MYTIDIKVGVATTEHNTKHTDRLTAVLACDGAFCPWVEHEGRSFQLRQLWWESFGMTENTLE